MKYPAQCPEFGPRPNRRLRFASTRILIDFPPFDGKRHSLPDRNARARRVAYSLRACHQQPCSVARVASRYVAVLRPERFRTHTQLQPRAGRQTLWCRPLQFRCLPHCPIMPALFRLSVYARTFFQVFSKKPAGIVELHVLDAELGQQPTFDRTWTWSISTEAFSYLFLPLLLFLLAFMDTLTKLLLAYIGAVFAGLCVSYLFYAYGHSLVDHWPFLQSGNAVNDQEWIRYYNPYLRLFDFWIGCVAAKLFLHEGALAQGWRARACWQVAAV